MACIYSARSEIKQRVCVRRRGEGGGGGQLLQLGKKREKPWNPSVASLHVPLDTLPPSWDLGCLTPLSLSMDFTCEPLALTGAAVAWNLLVVVAGGWRRLWGGRWGHSGNVPGSAEGGREVDRTGGEGTALFPCSKMNPRCMFSFIDQDRLSIRNSFQMTDSRIIAATVWRCSPVKLINVGGGTLIGNWRAHFENQYSDMDVSLNLVTCGCTLVIPVTSCRSEVDSFVFLSPGRRRR